MSSSDIDSRIERLRTRLAALDRERGEIAAQIDELQRSRAGQGHRVVAIAKTSPLPPPGITTASPAMEKLALFKSLFRGRTDVFPRRWENTRTSKSGYAPACRNEWIRGLCYKPRIKCGDCLHQAFIPVSDTILLSHLQGREPSERAGAASDFVAGVYPMLPDETCWFLAADFDKASWARDALAFLATARERDVPAILERSRSGNGEHVWIFFAEPIPAREARRLGAALLTETMERCPDIGFDSYDRFFPSQDTMPAGGFGNLIALPFQRGPRENGNSVFIDDALHPYEDQWAFLSTVRRMTRQEVEAVVETAAAAGSILGVRLPVADEEADPWTLPPSRRRSEPPVTGSLPERMTLVLGNQLYIARDGLPPSLVNRLIRLAAFQNPEFYAAQAMRLPTFGKPRIVSCAAQAERPIRRVAALPVPEGADLAQAAAEAHLFRGIGRQRRAARADLMLDFDITHRREGEEPLLWRHYSAISRTSRTGWIRRSAGIPSSL
jgi:hypothetical protein